MALINQLVFIVVSALCLIIGFWVLLSNKKSKANWSFFLSSMFILLWIGFGFIGLNYSHVFFLRLNFAAVSLFFVTFYFFSKYFPVESKIRSKIIDSIIVLIGSSFSLISLTTPLIVQSISTTQSTGAPYTLGNASTFFYAYVLALTCYILFTLLKKYSALDKIKKSQILYFIVGALLLTFFNVIFNIILPVLLSNGTKYYEFGDYSAIFFLGFTAYAIVKRGLFNIKVIATETTVVALSIGLLIEVFLSNNTTEGALKGIVWVLATYGGYVLIKSVKKEITQREELQKLYKDLEDANKHLKELDETKDNFLSMASHELNTPIAAIEGYLSMIVDEKMCGDLNEKAMSYLGNVYTSSKRLAALVKDLLNVSRIESNRIHLIFAETQIEDLIEQSIAEIKIKADQQKHTIVWERPKSPMPKTFCDTARIIEVIVNLLGNAIKYTDPGGTIIMETHTDGNKLIVSVKDNGRGIPADRKEHMFEKFMQADVLKDQVKGTGLGMFISKNLVELHKGKIWFKSSTSSDNHGTTFYFSLPILKEKPFDALEGQGPVVSLK